MKPTGIKDRFANRMKWRLWLIAFGAVGLCLYDLLDVVLGIRVRGLAWGASALNLIGLALPLFCPACWRLLRAFSPRRCSHCNVEFLSSAPGNEPQE